MLKTVGNPSTRYGDQTIIDGNLVIGTNGKGIDFSATPGTGTSELLDDYEEGTWSPTFAATGTGFTALTMEVLSATYTKVGRQVTVRGFIRTDNVDITGATLWQSCKRQFVSVFVHSIFSWWCRFTSCIFRHDNWSKRR